MKKLAQIISIIFLGTSLFAQNNWASKTTGFATSGTSSIHISFVDANVVWIQGQNGSSNDKLFAKSLDGGSTWSSSTIITTGNTGAIATIEGRSATTAYAAIAPNVDNGGIYKTTDGGLTWAKQTTASFSSAGSFPAFVTFFNDNDGVCVGDPTAGGYLEIYTTNNGGSLWTRVASASIPPVLSGEYTYTTIFKKNGNTVWFGTTHGRMYKSADKGLTWTVAQTPADDFGGFYSTTASFDFKDQSNGVIITSDHDFFRTTDGGTTWTTEVPQGPFRNQRLCYVPGTANTYISIGADQTTSIAGCAVTNDGGLTWGLVDEPLMALNAIAFFSPTVGLAGGFTTSALADGIWKYTGAPLAAEEFNLGKVIMASPNPTSGIFTIQGANVSQVEVFDVLGKSVFKNKFTALEDVTVNLSACRAGLYIVNVTDSAGNTAAIKILKQ